MVNKPSPELFRRKCDVDPHTGCWVWRQAPQSSGYGQVKHSGGKHSLVHRLSWEVHRGRIPRGLNVLHRCDNRLCCNPDHLFIGTQRDNWLDGVEKGRISPRLPRGSQSLPRIRKLTDADVGRIRSSGEDPKQLAAKLGVTRQTIYRIRNGSRKALVP